MKFDMNLSVKIEHNWNVSIISTLKNYMMYDKALIALNAGWNSKSDTEEGYFNFCVLLSMLLGFCEDYKHLIVNARHELILIRACNDYNCLVGNPAESEIELFKVQWQIPHVALMRSINYAANLESSRYLSMSFRSWDLYEYPLLQNMTKHSWTITATQLEKPRYVIFALQIGWKNIISQDVRVFDYNLSNVKFYLNSAFYPCDLNLILAKRDMFRSIWYVCAFS